MAKPFWNFFFEAGTFWKRNSLIFFFFDKTFILTWNVRVLPISHANVIHILCLGVACASDSQSGGLQTWRPRPGTVTPSHKPLTAKSPAVSCWSACRAMSGVGPVRLPPLVLHMKRVQVQIIFFLMWNVWNTLLYLSKLSFFMSKYVYPTACQCILIYLIIFTNFSKFIRI